MPRKALRPCRHSGCPNLTDGLYCTEHKIDMPKKKFVRDKSRKWVSPYHYMYGKRWQDERQNYLWRNPLCVCCKAKGKFVAATVVDHIVPHKGDEKLFWDRNNWQALCKPCHDHKTLTEDIKRTGTPLKEYKYDISTKKQGGGI